VYSLLKSSRQLHKKFVAFRRKIQRRITSCRLRGDGRWDRQEARVGMEAPSACLKSQSTTVARADRVSCKNSYDALI
jgi:hypothetical protein